MKKLLVFIGVFGFLIFPLSFSFATTSSIVLYQTILPEFFVARTTDHLVLDFSVQTGTDDYLNTIVVKNEGTAKNLFEIKAIYLWADTGNNFFDGFWGDNKISQGVYETQTGVWIFDDLNFSLPASGQHFFVTVDTDRSGTSNRSFQFSIPEYSDVGNNGVFDNGDYGVYVNSKEKLPLIKLVNDSIAKYKIETNDTYPPSVVITNLTAGQKIIENNFKILGQAKEQGWSFVTRVEVCIDNLCREATNTGTDYSSWEYLWTDISVGTHNIYTKVTDFNNNQGESLPINVTKEATAVPETPVPDAPPPVNPPATNIDYTVGQWLKLANQSAVYFLDTNNVRHAYPTQKVWQSYWGNDFSKVKVVSSAEMASYSLGRNVPFNVGTLMKIPSVPKVYYVDSNAVLRWVTTENAAIVHFGIDWAKTVKDLPESFFTDYTMGADIGDKIILSVD